MTENNDVFKKSFYLEVIFFSIFFILNALAIFLKKSYYDHLISKNCTNSTKYNMLLYSCKCAYLYPTDSFLYFRTIVEYIIALSSLAFIVIAFNEFYIQKRELFFRSLIKNPSKILFYCALISILIIIPLRLTCNTYGEDILVALVIILLAFHSIYFGR